MPERGGPTTQSGIFYQNSVAALYLGRMCDSAQREDAQRVSKVRVEAPLQVDDTVVTYADSHCGYIQAKEKIRADQNAWVKLWQDFATQFQQNDFQRGKDRLILHIGESYQEHHDLQEACERTQDSDTYTEWWGRLNKRQKALIEKIKPLLKPELLSDYNLLTFFGHIDVEIWPLRHVERDLISSWMPPSNQIPKVLFRLLRDRVGGHARVRGSFTADSLRESLAAENVFLMVPPDISSLRDAVRVCGAQLRQHKYTIAATGKHIPRSIVGDIVTWAQQSPAEERVAMLLDQAGMGKTVVMRDVLSALENKGVVLAVKVDQQLSGITHYEDLQTKLHLPDSPEHVVGRLAALEPVVVLIDQIDALSLSLARDQAALNIVLEFVARLRLIPGVRILLSCRTFDRNSDPRLKRLEISREFPLAELPDAEIQDILQAMGIDASMLSEPMQRLLRVPLHVDLFVRAIEGRALPATYGDILGIASLQDLYALLWRNVILKRETGSPPEDERIEVLWRMTERMNHDQQTSVSQSLFTAPETVHLQPAVHWLASEGILISSETEWSFLHQTFFDYCYAKHFVESGGHLTETIMQSDQGLFARPQLIQVLAYLRGSVPRTYIQELDHLFKTPQLRTHLQNLVLRWFGALPNPTDDEWVVARRMLASPATRPKLLATIQGNRGWFDRLAGKPLLELLSKDDQTLDTQVLPYLASLIDVAQAEVIGIIEPYIHRSEQWNNRVAWLVSVIRSWRTQEAVALFEEVCRVMPAFHLNHLYVLGHIATTHPQAGCRLVRLTFDRVLEQYHLKQDEQQNLYLRPYLLSELDTLGQGTLQEALNAISRAEPKLFIDTLLPWLEDILRLTQEPGADWPFYGSDDLSDGWHERTFVVQHLVIQAFITALTILARTQPEVFRQVAAHLSSLPYQTPQQLLANVYQAVAGMYTEDALQFLLADQRRLNLGDHQQYESRQLIKALYPFLASSQRATLESFICRYAPIWNWKLWGIVALNERGREQLHLLQTIPVEYLTEHGICSLRELERKFPHVKVPNHPITSQGGFVGSPISADAARKMSDKAWLRAMQKYQGGVTHREFLKGGAYQLASVLLGVVKEEPERFYRLLERVPDTVDTSYVGAFINGLVESTAPAEWFYNVIRRFSHHPGRDIKRTIAYAIEKRIEAGISDDVIVLLENYTRDMSLELIDIDKDPYHGYINSNRGSALRVLMRILDQQKTPEAKQRKWELIEFVVEDPATILRAGAIEELLYLLGSDRDRAVALFERLMIGYDALIHSHFTRDFLYHGMYKNFARIKPFIRALLDEDDDKCKQQGASLACIASLSPHALETPENLAEAQRLATEAIDGPPPCRRGAALIYAHNITGEPSVICDQELRKLLNDEDTAVQGIISGVFRFMQSDHINTLREFIEAYAASRAFFKGTHEFTEYLWEHGLMDPAWTLSVVEIILNNEYRAEASPWSRSGEELVRLVLRIYTHPTTDAVLRLRSMDVFDKLMERYIGEAQMVLGEWDKR